MQGRRRRLAFTSSTRQKPCLRLTGRINAVLAHLVARNNGSKILVELSCNDAAAFKSRRLLRINNPECTPHFSLWSGIQSRQKANLLLTICPLKHISSLTASSSGEEFGGKKWTSSWEDTCRIHVYIGGGEWKNALRSRWWIISASTAAVH